jgi:hypothetical protein
MYALIMMDTSGTGYFKAYLYMRDIVYFASSEFDVLDMRKSTDPIPITITPAVYNFIVMQENGVKTLLFSGSSNSLAGTTYRSSFIMKFTEYVPNEIYTSYVVTNDTANVANYVTEGLIPTFIGVVAGAGLWDDATSTIPIT